MNRWNTGIDFNDRERELARLYAKSVVASIFGRLTDPKDLAIMLERAHNLGLDIYSAALTYELEND